jgi:hypothetical protein
VDVQTAPVNQQGAVSAGGGTIAAADIVSVAVSCRSTYTVGGHVSGLSGSLSLQDNGGENLTLTANGSFAFATRKSKCAAARRSTENIER